MHSCLSFIIFSLQSTLEASRSHIHMKMEHQSLTAPRRNQTWSGNPYFPASPYRQLSRTSSQQLSPWGFVDLVPPMRITSTFSPLRRHLLMAIFSWITSHGWFHLFTRAPVTSARTSCRRMIAPQQRHVRRITHPTTHLSGPSSRIEPNEDR